ncbi:MAG: peptidyl-prolyl cis-trans isomerase [Candidatus Omnitrophica bacterium]|nr:peptidyl-prolyl cis-trans isomerase [Candidatus Omnitrophota bacterium]
MLKVLRKQKNMKVILWAICIIIIVTFVFFGISSGPPRNSSQPKYAGTLFGKKVAFDDFVKSYRACQHQAALLYGKDLPKVIDMLNLEEQAWQRLLLLREAKKRKIRVADKEVVERIILLFGENGKVNEEWYKIVLERSFNTTPRAFEEETRQGLQIGKLVQVISAGITLSGEELLNQYKNENEKVKAGYVLIEPAIFIDAVTADEEKIEGFYQKNKELFKTQPGVNVEYIAVTTQHTQGDAEISEVEIESYYQSNKESFKIKPGDENTEDAENNENGSEVTYKPLKEVEAEIKNTLLHKKAKDLALDIADEIEQDIIGGAGFKEAAQKHSVEIKETGFFSGTESIPEIGWNYQFLTTALELKKEEISNLVELPAGYCLIKLKEKKDSYIPSYDEIKEDAKKAYINKQALLLAEESAKEYRKKIGEAVKAGKGFKEAAAALSLNIEETDFFSRNDYIKGIGKSPGFIQSAFNLKIADISSIIRVAKGYCILTPQELKPIDEEQYQKDKEEFQEKALQAKKMEVYQIWFEDLLKQANIQSNL